MVKALTSEQVRFVALLAKTARAERDSFLGTVEDKMAESKPARGEHDPTAGVNMEVDRSTGQGRRAEYRAEPVR